LVSVKKIINELLVDIFNHILSIEARILKDRGVELSITEVHILEAIRNTEVPTMSNIARKLRVTVGTLTTSINTLERKDQVIKRPDLEDKRRVFIDLTKKAEEILIIHDEFHEEMIDQGIKDLNIKEDETLVKSLENIKNYFKNNY
jgi:DNA-binding MarR family transcriptional regulator